MGKVRGGDLSVLRDGGIPLSDPSLRSQRGREARQPFGIPGHCGAPLAGERHRPPSLASILIRVRHVAGVSPESHSFPARVAAFRVGPLGDASSARGGAGGCGARRTERPTAGVGRGRAAAHPATGGSGQACLASVTLGPGLESAVAQTRLAKPVHRPMSLSDKDLQLQCNKHSSKPWGGVGEVRSGGEVGDKLRWTQCPRYGIRRTWMLLRHLFRMSWPGRLLRARQPRCRPLPLSPRERAGVRAPESGRAPGPGPLTLPSPKGRGPSTSGRANGRRC